MKNKPAFTLVELMMAVLIFGFIAASLATLYSTANRHMFRNYRQNSIKANVSISMSYIRNSIGGATRLDSPAPGASGNILAFASNTDQISGCYPVSANHTANWHYFCLAPDASDGTITDLYYHTGLLNAGAVCACSPPTGVLPGACGITYPAFCGFGGGGSVTQLMQYAAPNPAFFSRRAADRINDNISVRVMLRSFWSAAGRNFSAGRQTDVDFTLDSAFAVTKPQ